MKIKSLAPWFGAKRQLAPAIVRELGEHRVYWEPFCGSMAVLFAKSPAFMETVNDLHGDITNLARVIQHPTEGPRLYRRLRRVWFSEVSWRDSADVIRSGDCGDSIDGERAFHFFTMAWQGRNGVVGSNGGVNFSARYTANGGHGAVRWRGAIESIPDFRRRLRHVTVLRRDAFQIIERIDDAPGTVIYLDPPYVEKGAKYIHDLAAGDHARLSDAAGRFKRARVVISYYYHPTLRELYPARDWTWRKLKASKAMVNAGQRDKRGAVAAPEVLIINGPSYVEPAVCGLFHGGNDT